MPTKVRQAPKAQSPESKGRYNPPRPRASGITMGFYVTDPDVPKRFELWVKQLAMEGKIDAKPSHAFAYMVRNFGTPTAKANGSLALDPEHRKNLAYFAQVFKEVGLIHDASDAEAITVLIDQWAELFRDRSFFQGFIDRHLKKGGV